MLALGELEPILSAPLLGTVVAIGHGGKMQISSPFPLQSSAGKWQGETASKLGYCISPSYFDVSHDEVLVGRGFGALQGNDDL